MIKKTTYDESIQIENIRKELFSPTSIDQYFIQLQKKASAKKLMQKVD